MSTIVTRSGKGSPLTNTEVDANFTNLNTDKAELSGAVFTGAITTNSTIDGRDVATDGTKLDGVEASADVTDATNVTAAGALMDSELTSIASVKALNQGVATGDSPTFINITATGIDITSTIADGTFIRSSHATTTNAYITNTNATTGNTANLYFAPANNISGAYISAIATEDFSVSANRSADMAFYTRNNGTFGERLKLTSTGIDVTGTATMDGLTVDGSGGRQYINSGHLRLSDDYNLEWGGGTNYIRGSNASGAMSLTATGNLTLDAAGDIILDADAGGVYFKDGGTEIGLLANTGTNFVLMSRVADKDIIFKGKDGSSTITALTLDMSAAGAATFNSSVTSTGLISSSLLNSANNSLTILGGGSATNNGANLTMYGGSASASAGDFRFRNGTTETARITAAGAATFSGDISVPNISVADDIGHAGDSDTYLSWNDNNLTIYNGGTNNLYMDAGSSTFNDGGADVDFRVESNGNANMLFVDGGNNSVGIGGTGVSTYALGIDSAGSSGNIFTGRRGTSHLGAYQSNDGAAYLGMTSNDALNILTNDTARLTISNSGNISTHPPAGNHFVINENGVDSDFRVESDGNANMLFVDGGNNHIGIGTATLNRSGLGADHICLTVGADTQMGMLELQGTRTSNADLGRVSFLNAGTRRAEIVAARVDEDNSTKLYFQTSNAGSLGTRLTIDNSGNVLVGQSTANSNTVGTSLRSDGRNFYCADGNYSGHFNRKSSDGAIVHFAKDDTIVGSIGTVGGDLFLGTGDTTLAFDDANDAIKPRGTDGVQRDGGISLGTGGNRFKDLYLSGKVQASYIYRSGENGSGLHFTANAIYPTNETAGLSDGTESIGAGAYRFKDLYLSGGVYLGGTGAANKLDDYEEGTFTAKCADASTGGNESPTNGSGVYTKTGRTVTVDISFGGINTTGMTAGNVIYITGLPFAVVGATVSAFYSYRFGGGTAQARSATTPSSGTYFLMEKYSGTSSDAGLRFIVSDIVSGTTNLNFSFTYRDSV